VCQALVGAGADARTTACRSPHRVGRRQDLRSAGGSGCVHEGDNPTGLRRIPAGAAGHTRPDPDLGRTTEAACLGDPQDSVRSRDQVGRQGI
jgi:hypothetical protein